MPNVPPLLLTMLGSGLIGYATNDIVLAVIGIVIIQIAPGVRK